MSDYETMAALVAFAEKQIHSAKLIGCYDGDNEEVPDKDIPVMRQLDCGHLWRVLPFTDQELDDLLTLARRGLEAEWRPIETAPKDGTWIKAYGRHKYGSEPNPETVQWENGSWRIAWTQPYEMGFDATHWQPIPQPPKQEEV